MRDVTASDLTSDLSPAERRQGDRYLVTDDDREAFARDGYVHLRGVMSDDEMLEIEAVYDRFLRGEITVAGQGLQRHDHRRARHRSHRLRGDQRDGPSPVPAPPGRATCSNAERTRSPTSCAARA
jgi:hypothetical protein